MRFLKLSLAYDGTNYVGWQIQPNGPAIQETLERAIEKVTGESIRVVASGRTDAGVHALNQVVSLATKSKLTTGVLRRALNANLPQDIAIHDVAEAPDGFHAIRDAKGKRYRYVIQRGATRDVFQLRYAWHVHQGLNVSSMHDAAQLLRGTHDFSGLEATGSERASSVRTIQDIFVRDESTDSSELIYIEVAADGFLYNMVRNIVGTLVEVGRGERSPSWVGDVLASKDRNNAGATAPPQGLFLVHVEYGL